MSARRTLRLRGTHWETPTLATAGWKEEVFELDPAETALVALHLWNVGDAGGPEVPGRFFVDMGTAECQAESLRVAQAFIRPAIDAARAAGMGVFHVEPANIAVRYTSAFHMLTEEEKAELSGAGGGRRAPGPARTEANPGWIRQRADRTHGAGYQAWDGWNRMRILSCCDAEEGDQVILTGGQLDRICRSRGIRNLVYAGFATNMCILDAPAGTREMLGFGYRVFLIREATLGVEYPDTFRERLMTRSAIAYFQQVIGDTVGFDAFLAACRAAGGPP